MYDWANSAYSTILITVMVSYIKDDLFPGKTGTLLYAWGIGLTMFVVAVCSPIFGAIADAHASKRRWLAGTALTGATASALMYFTTTDTKWLFAVLFLLSNFCFELSLCFYNGFLPEIADDENMGRISSWGYALGYVGGASGKDENYDWKQAKQSAALTHEQQEILDKRGVLSPEKIHRLASKTKKEMAGETDKASCHSDYVDADDAKRLQDEQFPLVELETKNSL